MKVPGRGWLAALIAAVAMTPLAAAQADRGGDRPDGRAERHGHGHDKGGHGHHGKRFSALIFSKTAAFRHTECIPSGTVAIAQMAVRNGFEVDATENAAAFTAGEPRAVRRGHLPLHHRRRAQRRAAGGVRGLHPGRRRLRRHPLRVRHRVRLGVVRRPRRRVLPRPSGQREPAVPDRDDERRGPAQRRHEAAARGAGRARRSGTTSAPTRATPSTSCCRSTSRPTTRAATASRRFAADGRPPDRVVPRVRRRPRVLHRARPQGRLLGGAAAPLPRARRHPDGRRRRAASAAAERAAATRTRAGPGPARVVARRPDEWIG